MRRMSFFPLANEERAAPDERIDPALLGINFVLQARRARL